MITAIRLNVKLVDSLCAVLRLTSAEIIDRTGINKSTWYKIMNKPAEITIKQLLSIANGLHIPVRRFFFLGNTFLVGNREDYITEPYLACDYDGEKMRDIVNDRRQREATWQRGAAAVNMSPLRLRNSIVGETRLPVNRFLDVCRAFSVDPFTILIDPNPELPDNGRKRRRSSSPAPTPQEAEGLRKEISDLRLQVAELSSTTKELTAKFKTLLADHEKLKGRVRMNTVNIENISNEGYLSISAET